MNSKIRISHHRQYPLADLEEVLYPLFQKYYTNDDLRVTIESANHVWCAYENDECIGCVLITDIGSNHGLYMILFGVKQCEQGRGIGGSLLTSIIKWSRQNHHTFIYLHTELENQNAIRFYEKMGFEKYDCQSNSNDDLPQCGSDVLPMMLVISNS